MAEYTCVFCGAPVHTRLCSCTPGLPMKPLHPNWFGYLIIGIPTLALIVGIILALVLPHG